jgi:hypothetical protein
MRCLPGSIRLCLAALLEAVCINHPAANSVKVKRVCFNVNYKLAPAAAEWSETMPRLPRGGFAWLVTGISKHCLVRVYFNFNYKLAPAAAEWAETMPRLPRGGFAWLVTGIPKHCLVRNLSSGIRAVAIEKPRNRHLPGFDREPRGPGQRPGVEPDVRSAWPLCPSPSVARVRLSRGCPGRPAGRAQRPLTPSAMILDPTDGGRAFLQTRPAGRKRYRQRPLSTLRLAG